MQASEDPQTGLREEGRLERYRRKMLEVRKEFEAGASGGKTIASRSRAMDELVRAVWLEAGDRNGRLSGGVALAAVGGYGRQELFPQSDIDLLFLLDDKTSEKLVKESIRWVSQELWDAGLKVAPATRKVAECEQFDPEVAEFTFSLLDHRLLAGNESLYERAMGPALAKLLQRENKAIAGRLVEMTRARHAKYGDTLFHLEPNIKDCPGGLRDVHVCSWITRLQSWQRRAERQESPPGVADEESREAVEFFSAVRCFLHFRHERDDNVLDWRAQDAAAAAEVGLERRNESRPRGRADVAYWMRVYFRHARSIDRQLTQILELVPVAESALGRLRAFKLRRRVEQARYGYRAEKGRLVLDAVKASEDPAQDPDVVLQMFVEMAESGERLSLGAEQRLSQALPLLSSRLEEGAALWLPLRAILRGGHAGQALRAMHAIGMLELLIPEFHGIDALVIRDAYHRYTVDEHTFVAIDTLHGLQGPQVDTIAQWSTKFSEMLRDMAHPELLYLAALLHDTGKGRSSGAHAKESVSLARGLLSRLDLDAYESGLVLGLIENHLEMSVALRRDIFDRSTVRAFSAKVATPEALRMLTLFTYADIAAVNPDALTPWKAENLWRLYMATANFLDRSVDEERVSAQTTSELSELVERVAVFDPRSRTAVGQYLDGFPERYLRTRSPEQVSRHFRMTTSFSDDPVQLTFTYAREASEITLVTRDRPMLFATMAGVLAAWGMNIVTADAFSNRQGVIVDSFRFTDSFRTLELNDSERDRFVTSVHDVLTGTVSLEKLLSGRKRGNSAEPMVVVEPRVDFDNEASSTSTLVQVVAQDAAGLLRALGLALAAHGCNIEVALVDTEGEMAIDVFYVTKHGSKLRLEEEEGLRDSLLAAMVVSREAAVA